MEFEKYKETNIKLKERIAQKVWIIISLLFFKPFSSNIFNSWRILLLRLFGARIGKGSIVYSSVYIPAPWNLTLGTYTCLGPKVQLHIAQTIIGNKVTVSQGSYLCSGSHDITKLNKPFISAPIIIQDYAWIAAEAFIGPGINIGEGAVIGARSAVFKNVGAWEVVGGNPAKFLKYRVIID